MPIVSPAFMDMTVALSGCSHSHICTKVGQGRFMIFIICYHPYMLFYETTKIFEEIMDLDFIMTIFYLSLLAAADGAEEIEESVGMIDGRLQELLERCLGILDKCFVLTLLAATVLAGCHAQEFAKPITGCAV